VFNSLKKEGKMFQFLIWLAIVSVVIYFGITYYAFCFYKRQINALTPQRYTKIYIWNETSKKLKFVTENPIFRGIGVFSIRPKTKGSNVFDRERITIEHSKKISVYDGKRLLFTRVFPKPEHDYDSRLWLFKEVNGKIIDSWPEYSKD
jgi:hypothetical protein